MFQNYGCVVDGERRGSRGLNRLRHAAESRPYALVIFGERLPGNLSGIVAAERYRTWETEALQRRRAVGDSSRPRHLDVRQQIAVLCRRDPKKWQKERASSADVHLLSDCTVRDLARLVAGNDARIDAAHRKHETYVPRRPCLQQSNSFRTNLLVRNQSLLRNKFGITMPAIQETKTKPEDTTPPPSEKMPDVVAPPPRRKLKRHISFVQDLCQSPAPPPPALSS